jgi:hypothetical protein
MKPRSGALPPLVAGLVFGAAAGASATWRLIRSADKGNGNFSEPASATNGDSPPPALLPRLFFLQAFSEQIEEVAGDVVASEKKGDSWSNASVAFEEVLEKVKKALGGLGRAEMLRSALQWRSLCSS